MNLYSKLSTQAKERLVSQIVDRLTTRDEILLQRIQIDIATLKRVHSPDLLHKEDALRGVCYDEAKRKRMYQPAPVVVPVAGPITDTSTAALVNIFLATPEIFPIAQQPGKEAVVESFNALLRKFATSFKWRANLTEAIAKGVRHNITAVEVGWKRRSVKKLTNEMDKDGALVTKEVAEEGFAIQALDINNVFWDQNVYPEQVSELGDYAGYVKRVTVVQLVTLLKELNSPLLKDLEELVSSGCSASRYREPYTPNTSVGSQAVNWAEVFREQWQQPLVGSSGTHEVLTMYLRTVPAAFGLKSSAASNDVVVWKAIIINGKWLAHLEELNNAHGLIPILMCRPSAHDPATDSASLTTELAPYQKMATALWSAELLALKRASRQRLLYDPSKLGNPEDLEVEDGDAHIAVKGAAVGVALEQIIKPIPVITQPLGIGLQEAAQITQMANLVGGQNQVAQGAFVKGNKTNDQFRQTIAGTAARTQLLAIRLEDAFMGRIREILASDILQYQKAVTIFDPQSKKSVPVDPVTLREVAVAFEVADGLVPVNDKVTPELIATVFQTVVANPQVAGTFNTADLVTHLLAQMGVRGLSAFKKSEQQLAAEQQQEQQMQQLQQMMQSQQSTPSNSQGV